jgi:hypothetical protein
MELYDAGVGDVIEIPAHHPAQVTVTGYAHADVPARGDFTHLSWQGTGDWSGWRGTTLLSDAAAIEMVAKAGPDSPVRKQYEADLEAGLARLLDTAEEV